jgi:hypothetical protein
MPAPEPSIPPDRRKLELRLQELLVHEAELSAQIVEDERPPGPLKSPLRSKQDEVRTRIADLHHLLGFRLQELLAHEAELSAQIVADKRPPGPLESPLRSKLDEVRTRIADLHRLLRC